MYILYITYLYLLQYNINITLNIKLLGNKMRSYLFTSESVSEGHPDKIADQISDAILDQIILVDKNSKVACETYVKSGLVIVGGEINTSVWVDIESIVRKTIKHIGYIDSSLGFSFDSCAVLNIIGKQSSDINLGIKNDILLNQGAGDQGMMFGYACKETDVFMPAPIMYAHNLVYKQSQLRKSGKLSWLYPDAKSQITFYYEDNNIISIDTVIFSTQHNENISYKNLRDAVMDEIILSVLPKKLLTKKTKFFINPAGRFVIGGPVGDCGLTGRKIIVDTYGGMARHGGGAFSGKDPSKVDRSGAYAARYIAKNIIAADLADKCEVQISYAIGMYKPISIMLETFGTEKIALSKLTNIVKEVFDLRPGMIIRDLNLLNPIYFKTSVYGHFGRNIFPWESIDKVDILCHLAKS